MKRQVKLRPSPAITDEQSDAEDVEEVRGILREKDKIFISTTLPSLELERTFINYSFFRYNSYLIRKQLLYYSLVSIFLMIRAGLPATIVIAGTSLVTTLPAPTIAP